MCAGLCVCVPQDNLRCHPQECHPIPWDMVSSLAWRLLTMTDHLSCKQLSFSASSLLELQMHTFMPLILMWILAISDTGPMLEEQELYCLSYCPILLKKINVGLCLYTCPLRHVTWGSERTVCESHFSPSMCIGTQVQVVRLSGRGIFIH